MKVSADSGDDAATLDARRLRRRSHAGERRERRWTVPSVNVPPSDVLVTSDKGGVDSDDVVITGAEDPLGPGRRHDHR